MTPLDSRMVDAGFYCPGLLHPGVKALIAMYNKLMMHFGCKSATGSFLLTSYSYLMLKLGVSFQPLQSSYCCFSFLATHSWIKMLWEKLDKFGIVVQMADSSFQFPWQGDKFLMLIFMDWCHSREALRQLNRVRLQLQIIFLSNVLTASNLRIDSSVFRRRGPGKNHSTKNWPMEEPTEASFRIWKEAMENICSSRMRVHSVGEYIAKTHRIHPWHWCLDTNKLLHFIPDSKPMKVYWMQLHQTP
jgi:hypothetical protein